MVGLPNYEVGVRDLGSHPERVTPLVRGAPWPRVVDAAQVYSFQDEGDLKARLLVMHCTARQIAKVLGVEVVDEDEVLKIRVAVQSKGWISAGTEVSLPLIDDDRRFQGVSEDSAVCHSHATVYESLLMFINNDQIDLAEAEQLVHRVVPGLLWLGVRFQPDHRRDLSGLYSGLQLLVCTDPAR